MSCSTRVKRFVFSDVSFIKKLLDRCLYNRDVQN